MNKKPHPGILQYWQALFGIASFLVAGGVFYNKVQTQQQKQAEIEARQDRQFQLIQSQDKRLSELEKQAEYQRGLRDGLNQKK
jgi:hypothetical protein